MRRLFYLSACLGFAVSILLVGCTGPSLHKPDQDLEAAFNRDRADFSRLVSMIEHDRVHILWIKTREMEPSDSFLSSERWDDYARLCQTIGIGKIERLPDRIVLISSTESQAFGHEMQKGYTYSRNPLSPVVPALDGGVPSEYVSDSKGVAYKALDSGWYIFMQQD